MVMMFFFFSFFSSPPNQDTTLDVQGLYDNLQYLFRVAAVNENGVGEYLQAENAIVAKMPFGEFMCDVHAL